MDEDIAAVTQMLSSPMYMDWVSHWLLQKCSSASKVWHFIWCQVWVCGRRNTQQWKVLSSYFVYFYCAASLCFGVDDCKMVYNWI